MRDYEYLYDLFPLDHSPMRPYPRNGMYHEEIFASMWKAFMTREARIDQPSEQNFADVLNHFGYRIEQRYATVVASVVCWFGTNCGGAFLKESEELGKCLSPSRFQYRYLMNWSTENMRLSYLNHGVRPIENCTGHSGEPFELTAADYEAVECLMCWLGSDEGQMFLTLCDQECKLEYERHRLKTHAEWLRVWDKSKANPVGV